MREIVAEVAGRLADHRTDPGGTAGSLAQGAAGIALLHAELASADGGADAHAQAAAAHLSAAAEAVRSGAVLPPGLFEGPVAFAFAATRTPELAERFRSELAVVDRRIDARLPIRLRPELRRIGASLPGATFDAYDVVAGVTGVGRYLLDRDHEPSAGLISVLEYLTALTRPLTGPTYQLPGWWVAHARRRVAFDEPDDGEGHANLGLAHGVCGPLALLALAWRAGVRVPEQDLAITRIVDWLLARRVPDGQGRCWPGALSRSDLESGRAAPPSARPGWCYGAPGTARAIQLAGMALHRPEWTAVAVSSTRELLADAVVGDEEDGLCHGRAGILHLTGLVGADAGDRWILERTATVATRIVERYDPRRPSGFATDAGLLRGAAGIALALHAYARGSRPVTGWDAALLVS
ncbi:lanthionine synthetase C family protein [Pseudonocardia humida]|uniref:Lanthionine synthetase C family protein n=1 Tax=Pseudonocardia humida TaxID=2800819 RepID=A0ABT1AD36_9PSEU|nr:lanthionine synthetase C family protein [Pseudonocardia humida]MCO1660985.1 lanthionine synthetase C family protein [Pseudonocardia humida]